MTNTNKPKFVRPARTALYDYAVELDGVVVGYVRHVRRYRRWSSYDNTGRRLCSWHYTRGDAAERVLDFVADLVK